jgi:hypothetical protein
MIEKFLRFISPSYALDHKGRVNKYTYVIMFQLLLICLMIAKMLF